MPADFPHALSHCVDLLPCPTCSATLHPVPGAVLCPVSHTFSSARQGYVSLLTGTRATSADDAAMAQARSRSFASGTYAPIRRVLARLTAAALPEHSVVVDAGCGPGYYLDGVLDQLP
ncbi:putative RNA methyltransferase [Streptomyces sp. NPDC056454]|uniref:putative RNA methyltransferase n=1 Tax=Streptomyces sp. NPDC056454 TaxID=3345823 RepID=UPI0036CCA934